MLSVALPWAVEADAADAADAAADWRQGCGGGGGGGLWWWRRATTPHDLYYPLPLLLLLPPLTAGRRRPRAGRAATVLQLLELRGEPRGPDAARERAKR
eukprot:scaffold15713_cov48-Phaeocystis_antarctica.AAC.1